MTSSPESVAPTVRRRRWGIALSTAVLAGIAAGSILVAAEPWGDGAAGRPGDEVAAVETQVAGISIERSSVDDRDLATTTVSPTTAAPAAVTVPTTQQGPDVTAATTTLPAPTTASPPELAAAPVTEIPPITAPAVSPQDAMRAQVLAAISFPWQEVLPGWRIEFMPARKGYRGSTFPAERLIQIYLRGDLTLADYVHVTAHELGHAVDVTLLDDADHEQWNEARGRPADAAWWVASGADDFGSGAGDWAESFAWSQLPSGRFYSRLAGPPGADQLALMASLIG